MGRQQILHHGHATVTTSLGVPVVGEELDPRRFCEDLLATGHAISHGGNGRSVNDYDIALAVQLLDNVFAGIGTGDNVIGLNRVVSARCLYVDGNDDDTRGFGLFQRGLNGLCLLYTSRCV